jgi:GT2 family glycosyltransferase
VWLAGYRVEFIPESVIYHKMGGTSDGIPSEFMQYHSFKNRVNSYIKNLSFSRLLKLLPIHLILLQFVAFSYLFTLKTGVFVAIQKSLVWNVLQLPNTLAKRKYIQEFIRMRPDIMFMPEITRNKGLRYYLWLLNYNMNGAFRNFKFVRMLKNE